MVGSRFRSPFVRWVGASALGWLMGLVLLIGLAALWSAIPGVGEVQFVGGVSFGAGVGYVQGRVLRERLGSLRPWLWASIVGLGIPFALWDVAGALGRGDLLDLRRCAAIGALLVGLLQWRVLRPYTDRAAWWVPASIVGWGLPVALLALAPLMIFFGGAVLGGVTGVALVRFFPVATASGPPPGRVSPSGS